MSKFTALRVNWQKYHGMSQLHLTGIAKGYDKKEDNDDNDNDENEDNDEDNNDNDNVDDQSFWQGWWRQQQRWQW